MRTKTLLNLLSWLIGSSRGFTFVPATNHLTKQSTWHNRYRNPGRKLNGRAEDDDEFEDDDEEDEIDLDKLGDWRAFRKTLTTGSSADDSPRAVAKENEQLLSNQNKELAEEYRKEVWAHITSAPEVGGLIVRMPLEVELMRNHEHSLAGKKLRQRYQAKDAGREASLSTWYSRAQSYMEEQMEALASSMGESSSSAGIQKIDISKLTAEQEELLQMYIDSHTHWQEVCLVVEQETAPNKSKAKIGLVLNRPMALQMTRYLAQLVLFGAYGNSKDFQLLEQFIKAFEKQCGVYVGGGDNQELPSIVIHGHRAIPGCEEVSPGIFKGGDMQAIVNGVLNGIFKPLDFRFFFGCHDFSSGPAGPSTMPQMTLDLAVVLGKYQPIACARSLALKQCIGLPKPLWHETLELCGGDMTVISKLEMQKRADMDSNGVVVKVMDENDNPDNDDNDDDDYLIVDELSELFQMDVDEDDDEPTPSK